mgnify:CR=1 FL=1
MIIISDYEKMVAMELSLKLKARKDLELKELEILKLQEQVETLKSQVDEYEQLYQNELQKNSCNEEDDEHRHTSFLNMKDKYFKRFIEDNSELFKEIARETIKEIFISGESTSNLTSDGIMLFNKK